jgi:tetratricopeptide (TPR) repeat protein
MMQKDNDSLVINLEKACQINEMFYGLESQIVSDDYYDIACAKRTQGNIDDAIMYFEKSYEIRKKMLLDPDIASADCLRSIGYLYITKLKYKEALVYLEKALAIYLIDKSGDNKKILQLGKDILILKNKISNNSVRGFKNTNTTSGGNSKIARNGPCPCGSHKKYKKCCGP